MVVLLFAGEATFAAPHVKEHTRSPVKENAWEADARLRKS
jgi:hypothetical protein